MSISGKKHILVGFSKEKMLHLARQKVTFKSKGTSQTWWSQRVSQLCRRSVLLVREGDPNPHWNNGRKGHLECFCDL